MKNTFLQFCISVLVVLFFGCSTNSDGEGDSTAINIPGPNITDIDGNTYQSVKIGGQTWIKQNLNVSKYSDGTLIPEVSDPIEWNNLTTGAWCYYNNDLANGPIYGKLYNWYAVAGIYDEDSAYDTTLRKKLAPTGWHIPSNSECVCESEWTQLINFLGGNYVAGGKIKEEGTLHWQSPNSASNISGFTALPGGYRGNFGAFENITNRAGFWTSSESDFSSAWFHFLYNDLVFIQNENNTKKTGYSVRCVKD
jgi:uncharacterized protein (TIGR02145 family)